MKFDVSYEVMTLWEFWKWFSWQEEVL